jgi:mannose-1-phosphate guanylyltransferase
MVWHPLAALAKVPGLIEILIIGFYEDSVMTGFIKDARREFPNIGIRWVGDATELKTATCGSSDLLVPPEAFTTVSPGIVKLPLTIVRDSILRPPVPQNIFICNIDICSSWPLAEMMELHSKHRGVGTILGVNVSIPKLRG